MEAGVEAVFVHAVVVFETDRLAVGAEAHRGVVGPVEEGGGVALGGEVGGYGADFVVGIAGKNEGFDEHGYAAEDGGEGVDALAAVGVAAAEGEALGG